ncbi:MAG: NrtA/SsuA/CpmA family ABC transporter substrate-binding protein [Deltaproteobacteria bacterium]|nr:NrtA/SsuA/CpmA family ABC transporter substrate-binding protein [Deltaproteobacteria bacterium]
MKNEGNQNPKGKRLSLLIAAIVVIGALITAGYFGLFQIHSPKPTEKLTIADGGSMHSAPLYVAFEKGFFKDEGLDVNVEPFLTGKIALDAVLGGKAHIATAAETPIMFEFSKGKRILNIGTISDSLWINMVIGKKDRGIETPKDLEGKRIAVSKGTSGEFFLDAMLIFHKIPREKVTIIGMALDKMKESLVKGNVDAVSTWTPYADNIAEELRQQVVSFSGQGIYKLTWNLVGMQEFIRKNPATVIKILRACLKSEAFIREYPEESRRILAGRLNMEDGPKLIQYWNRYNFGLSLSTNLLLNLEDQARWEIRNKMIDRTTVPNFLDSFYFDGLKAVKPEAVTIVHKEEKP